MPAGDLLTDDWQVEIGGLLTGAGTDFEIDLPGIQGLGVPQAKGQDVDRGHAAGSYLGRDYTGVRIITVPYVITQDTAADAGSAYLDLVDAWTASETDVELHLQVPGFGHVSFVGRPRGLTDDLSQLKSGCARALGTFFCGDPTMTVEGGS